ncbi:hypothetical protein [Natrinema amylolyticum]|uniref:hypothetical protein n=1 Tax=Natrinema amylolyticum TaxID=2878679 RepID=UPI001CF95E34|nr:hypothetical protein [Natrinema amylolyticum]
MNRRTILAGAGFAFSTPFAGCLADSVSSGDTGAEHDPDSSDIPDSPGDYPVNTGGLEEFDPESTYEEIDIGSREGVDDSSRPHDVEIWNEAAESEVVLRTIDFREELVVHHETYEIPDDTSLSVSLVEPSEYLIEMRVPATETQRMLRVPCHFFDCNASVTRIGIFEDGKMRSSVLLTTAACPSAEC